VTWVKSFSRIRRGSAPAARPAAASAAHDSLWRASTVQDVVAKISACIVQLRAAGYGETAEILAIARLDLLARLHGLSDEELELLIASIEEGASPRGSVGQDASQNKSG